MLLKELVERVETARANLEASKYKNHRNAARNQLEWELDRLQRNYRDALDAEYPRIYEREIKHHTTQDELLGRGMQITHKSCAKIIQGCGFRVYCCDKAWMVPDWALRIYDESENCGNDWQDQVRKLAKDKEGQRIYMVESALRRQARELGEI